MSSKLSRQCRYFLLGQIKSVHTQILGLFQFATFSNFQKSLIGNVIGAVTLTRRLFTNQCFGKTCYLRKMITTPWKDARVFKYQRNRPIIMDRHTLWTLPREVHLQFFHQLPFLSLLTNIDDAKYVNVNVATQRT